jgi:hypothetical protein
MPMYDYQCRLCTTRVSAFRVIALRDEGPLCVPCDLPMARVLSAPWVQGDYPAYNCPITGTLIRGKQAHKENLKRHGCRVLEAGEGEALKRRKARETADLDARIDATVESEIHKMPAGKREQLAAELQAGASAEIIRG